MGISYSGLMLLNREKINAGIFFILFLLRMSFTFFSERIWGDYSFFYAVVINIPFLIFAIWVNQKFLYLMYIDRSFMFILASTCFLLCFYYWNTYLEFILLAALFFSFIFIFHENFVYRKDDTSSLSSTFLFTGLGVTLPLLLLGFPGVVPRLQELVSSPIDQATWTVATRLSTAVFEVIFFWGISQMVLRTWGINNVAVFIIQIVWFWLAYIDIVPLKAFWITIPILGLWLAFITTRSKSLAPAIITLLTYNLIAAAIHLGTN